jgi:hypothetical protein
MTVAVMDCDVPSWVIRAMGQLSGPAIRQMTMIEPIDIIDFKELPFDPGDQTCKLVWIGSQVLHRIHEAGTVLRVLLVEGFN